MGMLCHRLDKRSLDFTGKRQRNIPPSSKMQGIRIYHSVSLSINVPVHAFHLIRLCNLKTGFVFIVYGEKYIKRYVSNLWKILNILTKNMDLNQMKITMAVHVHEN